jgi:hypothetical protein
MMMMIMIMTKFDRGTGTDCTTATQKLTQNYATRMEDYDDNNNYGDDDDDGNNNNNSNDDDINGGNPSHPWNQQMETADGR